MIPFVSLNQAIQNQSQSGASSGVLLACVIVQLVLMLVLCGWVAYLAFFAKPSK